MSHLYNTPRTSIFNITVAKTSRGVKSHLKVGKTFDLRASRWSSRFFYPFTVCTVWEQRVHFVWKYPHLWCHILETTAGGLLCRIAVQDQLWKNYDVTLSLTGQGDIPDDRPYLWQNLVIFTLLFCYLSINTITSRFWSGVCCLSWSRIMVGTSSTLVNIVLLHAAYFRLGQPGKYNKGYYYYYYYYYLKKNCCYCC